MLPGEVDRHRVDGEIASTQVLCERIAEIDLFRASSIAIFEIGAQRGRLVLLVALLEPQRNRPEADSRGQRAWEQRQHLIRAHRRSQIVVVGGQSCTGVAHAATDDPDPCPRFRQPRHHLEQAVGQARQPDVERLRQRLTSKVRGGTGGK